MYPVILAIKTPRQRFFLRRGLLYLKEQHERTLTSIPLGEHDILASQRKYAQESISDINSLLRALAHQTE